MLLRQENLHAINPFPPTAFPGPTQPP